LFTTNQAWRNGDIIAAASFSLPYSISKSALPRITTALNACPELARSSATMGSIPNNFPVSLRTWPASSNSDRNDLSKLIERINIERGGFQNITEESLRQEIAEAELDNGSENDSSDAEIEEEPDRLKQLMTAREEIIGQIEYIILHINILRC
jgi:hypothetical protein